MTLAAGTNLGSYRILSQLGAGGMGEVFRAHDTRLGRDVAIKVILEAFAADRERLLRFEREAKALATLNHPNVATLYGMEASDERHFLVMELVEGHTLAEHLAQGAIPLEQALAFGRQVAEALEAAHEKGIVHRDLKPANIKVTPDDKVKVLDFGLAKSVAASDPAAPAASLANSPTFTAMGRLGHSHAVQGTEVGVILGTASYMSPEQARGLPADHRSDIFSFGVVLYEMLSGRQPFQGETVTDVLASVLAREPDLSSLPPDLAPRLSVLLERCLEKHPKRRWQAIGDVRHELEVIAQNPRRLEDPASGVALAAAALAAPKPLWRRALPVAAGAILAAGLTAAAFVATRPGPAAPLPVQRFEVPYGDGLQRRVSIRTAIAISPDGTRVAYVANQDIYIRTLSDFEPRRIDRGPTANALSIPMNLAFSPDGQSLAYYDLADRRIKRLELAGGLPAQVCVVAANPNGITWHGDSLFFTGPGGIRRVPASGGEPEVVISNPQNVFQTAPQVLDDGRLLYSIAPRDDEGMEQWNLAKIVVQRPGDPAATTLVEGASDPRYLSSGHLVYQAGGVMFARRFDSRTAALGAAAPVVEGVLRGSAAPSAGTGWYAISTTGTLIYVPGPVGVGQPDFKLAWFDRAGKAEVLPVAAGPYMHPRVSRDGKRIAFSRADGRDIGIWVYELDGGGAARRMTFGGRDRYPIWSADSQWVIFQSDRGGDNAIYRQRADGSGAAARLTTARKEVTQFPETAAPDGSVFLFNESESLPGTGTGAQNGTTKLMAYSFGDRTSAPYGGITSAYKAGAEFSPDGKWLAYSVAERGGAVMPYVEPYPATGAKYQMSTAGSGGHNPMWSGDGRELFYTLGPASTMVAIKVKTSPAFSFAPPETVARPFTNSPPVAGRMFDAEPRGARFLGMIQADAADPSAPKRDLIRVVLNWTEELKNRVK